MTCSEPDWEGASLNLVSLKRLILALLLLTAGVVLVRIYWTEIVRLLIESWKILKETRISYVILASSAYLLSVYFFAFRWQQVLSSIGYELKATSLLPIFFGAAFVNNITPASRTGGESLRVVWANKSYGVNYTHALIAIAFERLVEAIPIALLSIYALYSFPPLEINLLPEKGALTLNSAYLLFGTILAAGVAIWVFREKFAFLLRDVQQNRKKIKKSFVPVLLLSCGVWALDVLRLKLIASALELSLPMNFIIILSVLYLVLGCLPITPGGLGVVEGGLISLLLYFGLSLASAGSFVFLERFVSYGLSSLIGGLYLFYYGGFEIWKNKK
ncbi:lysylphosphatidylglycerol synthase transmembrane domain-containing protein [Methanosarcina sp.]|uniref:lysylphosphatidylglycerol synthase transmembrane domain-containing protein n=1 Tax=Methanosarcina sp. TaxID=2213 RepID=UPI003C70C16A